MATRPTTDEADVRQAIDTLVAAIRAMDIEGVTALFAPDMVSFDIEPPLEHRGRAAKRTNWENVFATFRPPLGYEVRDLTITMGGEVAFGRSLNRISGTLKDGKRTGVWVRATTCFRKIDGRWLIAHDHVSVPVDPASGKAFLDLEP